MYDLLDDIRIVEMASFIAAPSCTLHLAQLGAEVIRIDQIGGGPDFKRWPLSKNGESFYWEGLNKGKKSVAINLSSAEGRELATELITAPGVNSGLFVTNFPAKGFLSHDLLAERRPDLITTRVMGWADGSTALDYTVNAAVGFPLMTGPPELGEEPVNHMLPAWDIAAGLYAAFALMAAERKRSRTGKGGEIRVPLADIAMTFTGHLGLVGEVAAEGHNRPRYGNDLFGSWGRNFVTSDDKQVMLVAITPRQWNDLITALGIADEIAIIEKDAGINLSRDDGLRFVHRKTINPLVARIIACHSLAELSSKFLDTNVCWHPYLKLSDALNTNGMFKDNTVFSEVAHLTGISYPTPGAVADFVGSNRLPPVRAPRLGEHTEEILAETLGLPEHSIAKLNDAGTIAGDK